MTFNYDEKDDFDEADEFDEMDEYEETDDFEPEPEDDFLDEEDEPNTALSLAFQKAAAPEIDDEDEDDDADDEDDLDDEVDHESPDEQLSVKPIDLMPDEDDTDDETEDDEIDEDDGEVEDEDELEIELPTLELPPVKPIVEQFRPQEQSNTAYADAVTAYYVERNYQRAIEKFDEAIAYEAQHTEDNANTPNEIVAKSKYWQAEAYAKLHDLSQAVEIFDDLAETCKGHYLVLAAERRSIQFKQSERLNS